MLKFFLLIAIALTYGGTIWAADSSVVPPPANILAWWKLHSSENITLTEPPMPVVLRSGELAYLASATLPGRSDNKAHQVLLIRPNLQEVQEAGAAVQNDSVVLDMDEDGISEIMALSTQSIDGIVNGSRAIVQFDGWEVQILHQAVFNDNLAICEHSKATPKCVENSVEWIFADLNHDDRDELIEKTIKSAGPNAEHLKIVRTKTVAYLFKNGGFVKGDNNLNKRAGLIR